MFEIELSNTHLQDEINLVDRHRAELQGLSELVETQTPKKQVQILVAQNDTLERQLLDLSHSDSNASEYTKAERKREKTNIDLFLKMQEYQNPSSSEDQRANFLQRKDGMLKSKLFMLQKKKTQHNIEKQSSLEANLLAHNTRASGRKMSVFNPGVHENYMDSLLKVSNSAKKQPGGRKRESSFYARSKLLATPAADENLPEQNAHYFKRLYKHFDNETSCHLFSYEFAAWFLKDTNNDQQFVVDCLNSIS